MVGLFNEWDDIYIMRFGEKLMWSNANIRWDANSYLWNDVRELLQQLSAKQDVTSSLKKLKKSDKKKLIRLIMHLNGVEVYDEKKEIQNIQLHVEDVKLIIKEVEKNVQIIY